MLRGQIDMSRKPALVRQSTITKVIKGALKAGAKVSRVEVRPDGSFTLFNEDGPLTESSSPKNSWDEVLE
jgi:hypothetical protein